ncbi:MAG: lipopolysaccharide assembly protein LapA domain-containing protein [Gallionella sp.]
MRLLNWLLRAALFILLLGLAVKNDETVKLKYFFGLEWETNLVILLLVFFAAGALAGILAMFASLLKQRREISRLKRDIRLRNELGGMSEDQQIPIQPS